MASETLLGRRVLVVEDEYMIATDIAEALMEAGAQVIGSFASVERALAAIEDHPQVDAAVLDVNLGGEMVYPAADALMARGVPFLLSTGYDASAIPGRFDGLLRCEKPTKPTEIVRAISTLLRQP